MKDYFLEILVVVLYSKRIQLAIFLGLISFITISLYGESVENNIQSPENMAFLTEVIQEKFHHRFGKLAFGTMISFFILAFKFYKKDKNRIW